MIRRGAFLWTVAVLALAAGAPPARGDDVAEAKAHVRRGAELYRAGKWRDAIAEFEAAYRLKPHGAIHFNVAQCREKLGEWPGALRGYHDYLREVPDAQDRAAVRATIRRMEERLAAAGVQALLVYSDPPGAEVRLDGRARGTTPFHTVLPPGTYAVAVALEGHEAVAEEVALAPGASRAVDLVLRPVPKAQRPAASAAPPAGAAAAKPPTDLHVEPPAPGAAAPVVATEAAAPGQKRRVYTWVAAGTAVAAAAAGAYFGWAAQQDADAVDDVVNDGSLAQSTARDAESKARTANVLYAVSGAAAAAGITLFFVEGKF